MGFPHIIERHAEEASELWVLRSRAVCAPHYFRRDIAKLDARIEANFEGLRVAGKAGERAAASLALDHPGAAFARTVVALHAKDPASFAKVLDALDASPELATGVLGALAWVPLSVSSWATRALVHGRCPPILRRFGLATHIAHRSDPGPLLADSLTTSSAPLRSVALEGVGILGREDLLDDVKDDIASPHSGVRRAACWSAALLGDQDATQGLWEFADPDTTVGRGVLELALARSEPTVARGQLTAWSLEASTVRCAVAAAGILGSADGLDLIVQSLEVPTLARIAGEAFSRVTGIKIDGHLRGAPIEAARKGPTDDPADDRVEADPDEALSWPNVEAVRKAHDEWRKQRPPGARLLLGAPLGLEQCDAALQSASQRVRFGVALERAILTAGPVANVGQPAHLQRRVMSRPQTP
ncbi:MAG: HEAT repeat domain-containing protein [Polyangiaceae bacterium]